MARITVEDCLRKVDNRFGLIHLAAKRVRQLRRGSEPMVVCKNKDIVVALREIAAGNVFQGAESDEQLLEEMPETTASEDMDGKVKDAKDASSEKEDAG
jgi:DNA-directed RNA polymerase subunit omega